MAKSNITQATAFQAWYHNADMPELQNGVWVDLETGLPFQKIKPVEVFDGQDLEGTVAQQKSAGKIRAKMVAQLTAEQAEIIKAVKSAKWFVAHKSVLISNIIRFCNCHIAMTNANNRKQLQWLKDSVGLGFGKSTFNVDGKLEDLPANSTIVKIEQIIAQAEAEAQAKAEAEAKAEKSQIATVADVKVGTKVFFSRCFDSESGDYIITSSTVIHVEDVGDSIVEFILRDELGNRSRGYASRVNATLIDGGEGAVYLTAEAVPVEVADGEEDWG